MKENPEVASASLEKDDPSDEQRPPKPVQQKLRRNEAKRRRIWLTSPLALAVVGLLGTGIGASLQGYWNTQLERQKFESTLIQKALETSKKEEAANNLKFLVDAGLIQSLDKSKIAQLAKTPANLPTGTGISLAPSLTRPNNGNRCVNAPLSATLNYWPVTYLDPAEVCHDFPAVDARLTNGQYSQSQDEWEAGRTAHTGDELFVAVWINNGAADNADQIFPGRGVAHSVRLLTQLDIEPRSLHYIWVQFAGDNTNTVSSRFKIITAENERLSVVPSSGEIYDETGQKLLKSNLEIGNNVVPVGDFKPLFTDGRFVRFRVKVIS